MRKLKVVSNGTSAGTKIVDAETGEDLHLPVTAIRWEIRAGISRVGAGVGFDPMEATAEFDFGLVGAEVLGIVSDGTRERWVAAMRSVLRNSPPEVSSTELSECPFCGNPTITIEDEQVDARTFIMYACCLDCGAHGPHHNTADRREVTHLWNVRASDAALLRFVREVANTPATPQQSVSIVLNEYVIEAEAILRGRGER